MYNRFPEEKSMPSRTVAPRLSRAAAIAAALLVTACRFFEAPEFPVNPRDPELSFRYAGSSGRAASGLGEAELLAVSPDGGTLALRDNDTGTLVLFDMTEGRRDFEFIRDDDIYYLGGAAFSADGSTLVLACDQRIVRLHLPTRETTVLFDTGEYNRWHRYEYPMLSASGEIWCIRNDSDGHRYFCRLRDDPGDPSQYDYVLAAPPSSAFFDQYRTVCLDEDGNGVAFTLWGGSSVPNGGNAGVMIYDPVSDIIAWQYLYNPGTEEFSRAAVTANAPVDGAYSGNVAFFAGAGEEGLLLLADRDLGNAAAFFEMSANPVALLNAPYGNIADYPSIHLKSLAAVHPGTVYLNDRGTISIAEIRSDGTPVSVLFDGRTTVDGEYRSIRGIAPVGPSRSLVLDEGAHKIWSRDDATGVQLPATISTTDQGLLDWSFSGIWTDGSDVYLAQWNNLYRLVLTDPETAPLLTYQERWNTMAGSNIYSVCILPDGSAALGFDDGSLYLAGTAGAVDGPLTISCPEDPARTLSPRYLSLLFAPGETTAGDVLFAAFSADSPYGSVGRLDLAARVGDVVPFALLAGYEDEDPYRRIVDNWINPNYGWELRPGPMAVDEVGFVWVLFPRICQIGRYYPKADGGLGMAGSLTFDSSQGVRRAWTNGGLEDNLDTAENYSFGSFFAASGLRPFVSRGTGIDFFERE